MPGSATNTTPASQADNYKPQDVYSEFGSLIAGFAEGTPAYMYQLLSQLVPRQNGPKHQPV